MYRGKKRGQGHPPQLVNSVPTRRVQVELKVMGVPLDGIGEPVFETSTQKKGTRGEHST